MKKYLPIFAVVLMVFAFPVGQGFGRSLDGEEQVPSPQLVRPTSETVDISGKDSLEFKWLTNVAMFTKGRQYYDFRLYKGYQMLESTLIYKERLSDSTNHIIINTSTFENGQIYTWSLRQVFGVAKSDRSHVSFKVIKK